jgi:hypothetical protein
MLAELAPALELGVVAVVGGVVEVGGAVVAGGAVAGGAVVAGVDVVPAAVPLAGVGEAPGELLVDELALPQPARNIAPASTTGSHFGRACTTSRLLRVRAS